MFSDEEGDTAESPMSHDPASKSHDTSQEGEGEQSRQSTPSLSSLDENETFEVSLVFVLRSRT